VLASGGGGSYQVAREIVEAGVDDDARIELIGVDELVGREREWLAVSANMGAPDALFKTANPRAPTHAFEAMSAEAGLLRTLGGWFADFPESGFSYVLPVEVGAINSASPLAVAAQLGRHRPEPLPVIDADGAGRSIPTLDLTVFTGNVSVFPAVVASESLQPGGGAEAVRYNSAVINTADEEAAEQAIIGTVTSAPFGGIAGLSIYPMPVGHLLTQVHPVAGTLSLALAIGRDLEASRGVERAQRVAHTIQALSGRVAEVIWHGWVIEIEQAEGGVDVGRIVLDDASGSSTRFTIYNENENVYAMRSDQAHPCVIGPDSVCYVTAGDDPVAIDNSDLNRLYRESPNTRLELFILGVQAAPQMRSARLLKNFARVCQQLGYGGRYIPWEPGNCSRD